MANVGGRQLTLGACGLTKFAETADGRKVQLHIPKYVQGPVGRACRYADRGCPFRSQRGTALSSHERSCKKQPPPVVPALVWSLRTLHFLAYRQCQRQARQARLKTTGSHPLNALFGNPMEPVVFIRRVGSSENAHTHHLPPPHIHL